MRRVLARECWDLRSRVLRPGLPLSECQWPCDSMAETFHLGCFLEGRIVGIATFHPEGLPADLLSRDSKSKRNSDSVPALVPGFTPSASSHSFRLRGMAVDPDIHRMGIGRRLIVEGESVLRSLGADLLWFNARENAFSFYSSLGYEFVTEMFDIPGVGPHKVMLKKLIF